MNVTRQLHFLKLGCTDRQADVMNAITELTEALNTPPTIRELAEHLKLKSNNSVKEHLLRLRTKGLVSFRDNQARTITITDKAK